WGVPAAFSAGVLCGALLALAVGLLALCTGGVAFMSGTKMFSQALFLAILYFAPLTRGDPGRLVPQAAREIRLGAASLALTDETVRYMTALALFSAVLFMTLAVVRSRHGRVLVAIRENEERTKMLGYDIFAGKLAAMVASGTVCAVAGAA